MSLTLRQLRYFVAVAEELNFTRAAARLRMAQPPLSQQIKQLEVQLHTTLFQRSRRSVRLTREGNLLLDRARPLLAEVDEIETLMHRSTLGQVGTLRVGYVASTCFETLPSIVREFRHRFPDVQLQLNEFATGPQLEALLGNRLDVGLLRGPVVSDALEFAPLVVEPLLIAVPDSHPLAGKPGLCVSDLRYEPFLIHQRQLGAALYDQIMAVCQAAGFSPNVVQETGDAETIQSLISAEIGVGLVPASVASMRRPRIVYTPVPLSQARLVVGVANRIGDDSPIVHHFRSLALRVIGPDHRAGLPADQPANQPAD